MTRRLPPEERRETSPGPLFAGAAVDRAREQGHRAAESAASKAARIDPGWKRSAVELLRAYAATHSEPFLIEHVGIPVPEGADRRALGHVAREAQRLGYIEIAGYAPAVSSNGSPKCRWRSLISEEART